ncbi:MAG: hypothetical protein GY932_11725 [Arcobacter sp.]|nr:hypothetical protein [Arcobacter sp.]
MIFTLSFYIFSVLLSYLDCTRYKIPNLTLFTLLLFLIIFGLIENELKLYSFAISLIILVFFVIILLIMPKSILGGGDIKYMMVISIYLDPILFPHFLLLTGLMQLFFLLYFQKIKNRKVAPMAPAMFLAVIGTEVFEISSLYM